MTEYCQLVLFLTVYRFLSVLIGLVFVFLGYKLFCRGVYDRAGDLNAALGDHHLALKQAAPGTFFALFGVVVIGVGLWRGIEIDIEKAKSAMPFAATQSISGQGTEKAEAPRVDNEKRTMVTKEGIPLPKQTHQLKPSEFFFHPLEIDSKIKVILRKASEGNTLEEKERKILTDWLEKSRIHIRVDTEPPKLPAALGPGEPG